jgi:hypothetical protein
LNLNFAALFTVVVMCFTAGCRHEFRKADLSGTYIAIYSFGTEELCLAANGTYLQTFTPADKSLKAANTSGNWTIDGDELQLVDSLLVQAQKNT